MREEENQCWKGSVGNEMFGERRVVLDLAYVPWHITEYLLLLMLLLQEVRATGFGHAWMGFECRMPQYVIMQLATACGVNYRYAGVACKSQPSTYQ